MAIAPRDAEFYEGMLRAFAPQVLANPAGGLGGRGLTDAEKIAIAQQMGIPYQYDFDADSGGQSLRIDPRSRAESQMFNEALRYGGTLESLYNQHVPQAFRDSLVDARTYTGGVTGPNYEIYDPATGQRFFHNELLDQYGVTLPENVANQYSQLGLRPAVNKEAAGLLRGDDLGIGEYAPLAIMAMLGGHFAGVPGVGGAEAAGLGEAVSGTYGATAGELANAAASYGGGLGGASVGGTVAGGLMPPAIPVPDPTFGNALIQTAPGVYAAPGAAGYVGASGLGGAVYGADIPSMTVPGAGTNAPSPQMPKPPVPPGSTTLLGQLKDLAKDVSPYAPLLGMAAGGLAGAAGGGGQAGTITVEEGIPDWLMPYVKPTLDKYSTEVQNYQTDPYGVMPAAMQQFKDTVSGMYLDPSTNKWLEEYYKLGAERIKGTLSPSFGHMQAFGSHSGYNEALSRGLGDFATGLYGGNYAKERDRQTQMTAAAPNFLTQSSTSAFAPYSQYLNAIGNLGKKKDQPYWEPSMMQNILGGAMAGYGLGSIFK